MRSRTPDPRDLRNHEHPKIVQFTDDEADVFGADVDMRDDGFVRIVGWGGEVDYVPRERIYALRNVETELHPPHEDVDSHEDQQKRIADQHLRARAMDYAGVEDDAEVLTES